MISTTYRTLFVHIPKCAGQSIEHFFLRAHRLDWASRGALCLRPNTDPSLGPPRLAHMTAEEYVQLAYLSREDFNGYYKFSFVRNPWSRLVSEYRYRPRYSQRHDFKTFVFKKMPASGWTDEYRHVMPQMDYLTDANGELLVDFVGRFENLTEDFAKVCQALGFADSSLPRVNVSEPGGNSLFSRTTIYRAARFLRGMPLAADSSDYRAYYDSETREYVADLYARDIAAFSYSF